MNKHRGSDLEDFLREENLLEEVDALAAKRLIAYDLSVVMDREHLTTAALARRMGVTRGQVERLLDPENEAVTIATLAKGAAIVGQQLNISLTPKRAV